MTQLNAFTANTSPSTIPDGIDRSIPAVAMTKVVPTLTTVRIETFSASCSMFDRVPNWPGAAIAKNTIVTIRKMKVITTGLVMIRRHGGWGGVHGDAGAFQHGRGDLFAGSRRVDDCFLGLRLGQVSRVVLDVAHAATSFV